MMNPPITSRAPQARGGIPSVAGIPPTYQAQGQAPPAPAVDHDDAVVSIAARQLMQMEQTLGQNLEMLAPKGSGMIGRLEYKFWDRRNRRLHLERDWLEAYQRFLNQYPANILARLDPRRSRIWVGLTAMYVNAAHSAIMDFIRGTGDEQAWQLDSEQIPDNFPIPEELRQVGVTVNHFRQELQKRVEAMTAEMNNQLDDSRYEEQLDLSVLQSCITGTGAIKGPFTVVDSGYNWNLNFDINLQGSPSMQNKSGFKPICRHASIMNLYPDMDSTNVQDGDGIFEEFLLSKHQLMNLATRPGFNSAAVIMTLREAPQGDYTQLPHQVELQAITGDAIPHISNRYRVKCYFGEVTGQELHSAGLDIPHSLRPIPVIAEIWYVNHFILKAKKHDGPIPYHMFPFSRRPTTPFGRGIPELCKNSQNVINGSARAIMDNMAIASGPIIERNTRIVSLQPGKDPTDIQGWQVFLSNHKGDPGTKGIQVHDLPAYTDQFLRVFDRFMQIMEHETFIPALTQGIQRAGQTKTFGGMSLLQSNASKTIKKVLRYIDDCMIEPLMRAWYDWNMRYNPKEHILVPGRIRAKGSMSLLSNEVLTHRMLQLLQVASMHPRFNFEEAINRIGRAMGIPMNTLVFTEEQQQMMQELQNGSGGQPPGLVQGQGQGQAQIPSNQSMDPAGGIPSGGLASPFTPPGGN